MSTWVYDINYPVVHIDQLVVQQGMVALSVRQAPILSSRQCGVVPPDHAPEQTGRWWLPILLANVAPPPSGNNTAVRRGCDRARTCLFTRRPRPPHAKLGASPPMRTPDDTQAPASALQAVAVDACTSSISFAIDVSAEQQADDQAVALALNVGRYGFYRVNYTAELWASISDAASSTDLVSDVDLAGLLSDAYFLTEQKQLGILPFLSVLNQLGTRFQVSSRARAPGLASSCGVGGAVRVTEKA